MADYLVVHVISVDLPSGSKSSRNSYFVKLHYNGQNCTSSIKEHILKWDEKICFRRRAQPDHSGDLTLEAKVYNLGSGGGKGEPAGATAPSKTLGPSYCPILAPPLNSESLIGTVLLSDDDFDRHSDNAVAIRHPWRGTCDGGALHLKLFLAAADEVQLDVFNVRFATDDLCSQGNTVGKHPLVALRPADAAPKKITPNFEPGRVVERMQHLFVRVVKARRLPDVDANGSLDLYVEITFGPYNKGGKTFGVTKCLKRNKNPEWNETFGFAFQHGKTSSSTVDVVVNDKDLVRDDFVGKLCFDVAKIPERSPDDIPLEPTWYPLLDQGGKALARASLLVAIWIGSQADEAYRHAWVSLYSPKVYENPRLWCLRVTIVEAQGIGDADDNAGIAEAFCKACLGELIQKTRTVKRQMKSSASYYVWNEDLVFVAAEPLFEGDLVVSIVASPDKDEIIGTLTIPLASIDKTADDDHHPIKSQWFDLKKPAASHLVGSMNDGNGNSHMQICLRNSLDGRYHIGHDPQGYIDDTRPADRKLWNPPIGSVHLGILRAIGLTRIDEDGDGKSTLKPYCVAKYGNKWVRTRTVIDGPDHVFNEQYTWDVYDIATVLKIGVFDHCVRKDCAHRNIGKVCIQLSCLEANEIYAHSYPLVILSPCGAIKIGELELAVKISLLASSIGTLRMHTQPSLPRMHYVKPLADMEQDSFLGRHMEEDNKLTSTTQAAKVLALRLGRMEPPLRSEVVECMCRTDSHSWSLRKAKANFNRLKGMASPFIVWFGGIRSWRNSWVTLLDHAIFVLALWFPRLVLLLVLLYAASVVVWNHRLRPSCPPYVDYRLSFLDTATSDELDEELDAARSSCNEDLLRMRYERLRLIAGRGQTVMGDLASWVEQIQSLVTWRDPRATAIFYLCITVTEVMAYFVSLKVLVAIGGFYVMRHPRFRTNMPSVFVNFFQRLPSKQCDLL